MKTMTCKQLGGACDMAFHANSFAEIAEMSKQHGTQMFHEKEPAHLQAMNEMKMLMKDSKAMQTWFENKQKEFEVLVDDSY